MRTKSEQLEGEGVGDEVCASCGIAAIDDVKLKDCDGGCDLVKYCGDGCQINHREEHDEECNKRKIELHDKDLFTKQSGMSHHGECPICCLPLSLDVRKSSMMSCCCKVICNGCSYANQKREVEQGLEHRCPFCREPEAKSDEKYNKRRMNRIKKHNDPVAMTATAKRYYHKGDNRKAVEYYTKAAELGDVEAHYCLGCLYYNGEGVEKDMKKALLHLEQAAIGGHAAARILLAFHEEDSGRFDRAAKHFIIAANLGWEESLKCIKQAFIEGIASKEDYAAALRGYQAAVDATKSDERDEAEKMLKKHASLTHLFRSRVDDSLV